MPPSQSESEPVVTLFDVFPIEAGGGFGLTAAEKHAAVERARMRQRRRIRRRVRRARRGQSPICDGEFAGPNACTCGHPERHG